MALQQSSVRNSLHWHVIIVKCQSRNFHTAMPSVLFIDLYFIFKFINFVQFFNYSMWLNNEFCVTVLLGVRQPRLQFAIACCAHRKGAWQTISFVFIRQNEAEDSRMKNSCQPSHVYYLCYHTHFNNLRHLISCTGSIVSMLVQYVWSSAITLNN